MPNVYMIRHKVTGEWLAEVKNRYGIGPPRRIFRWSKNGGKTWVTQQGLSDFFFWNRNCADKHNWEVCVVSDVQAFEFDHSWPIDEYRFDFYSDIPDSDLERFEALEV